jgi:cytoskeletal protein CcmA (bactofilin family)
MFGKDDKKTNSQVEIPNRDVKKTTENEVKNSSSASVISKGLKIKGEISGTTDLEIYGNFDGTITLESNNVNIENSAKVKADIKAKTIRVNGEITGNLTAIEKILVTSKGSVIGDLNAGKVEIQDGANFDGNISMKKQNSSKPNK